MPEQPPYDATVQPGKWGMTIDQDLCIGCQACVTACAMENNVAWVGEDDASYSRWMHWIRIERFWVGTYPDISINGFQPMLCQQCGHAPCEPVCPVYASVHSQSEETNLQIYNRCVGTRYCANNCPYQVRSFNWRDYTRPASFDNLFNPDVTVRKRGVMEKCTFCLQRIRRVEDLAHSENRPVRDGEVVPACAQACPTNAIVFGHIDDPTTEVRRLADEARNRNYLMLEELGTYPRITYLKGGPSHG